MDLLKRLETAPRHGERFAAESVSEFSAHLPLLISISEDDCREFIRGKPDFNGKVSDYDCMPLLLMCRQLYEASDDNRDIIRRRFAEVRNTQAKILWAAQFLRDGKASDEMAAFLRKLLASDGGKKEIESVIGPEVSQVAERLGR